MKCIVKFYVSHNIIIIYLCNDYRNEKSNRSFRRFQAYVKLSLIFAPTFSSTRLYDRWINFSKRLHNKWINCIIFFKLVDQFYSIFQFWYISSLIMFCVVVEWFYQLLCIFSFVSFFSDYFFYFERFNDVRIVFNKNRLKWENDSLKKICRKRLDKL